MMEPESLPLRDIHLPAEPGWWPPAPGWWILAVLVAGTALFLYYRHRRMRQQQLSAVQMAKTELESIKHEFRNNGDAIRAVQSVSALLRRLVISLCPREKTAGLTGQAWLEFLDGQLDNNTFSRGAGRVILDAPYRKVVTTEEAQSLLDVCHLWIDQAGSGTEANRS